MKLLGMAILVALASACDPHVHKVGPSIYQAECAPGAPDCEQAAEQKCRRAAESVRDLTKPGDTRMRFACSTLTSTTR